MSDVTVTFGAKDEGLASSLKKFNGDLGNTGVAAGKSAAAVGKSFGSMIKAGAGLAIGLGAVMAVFKGITGTIGSFVDALDMGGRLSDTASRTGILAGEVLLLERAFQNTGLSADDVATTLNKMQKAIAEVNEQGEPVNKVFAQIGLSMEMLKKLTPDEQFKRIGAAISAIPDPAERAAIAMGIFGKSGGALLPLFRDFGGTMSTASGQLGSMVSIMNENANAFDAVSDKINVIKGKFVEFAAGILTKIVPALDFITEALSRIDAAKIGSDLAKAFIGATTAMEGFGAATNAIKAGDLGLAFSLAFSAISLQAKETANQIYAHITAAFSAAGQFLGAIFALDGALAQTLLGFFDFAANKIVSAISRGLAQAFAGSVLTEGLSRQLNIAANDANIAANKIQDSLTGAGGRIGEQFTAAGKAFPESFASALETTVPLFSGLEEEAEALRKKMQSINTPAAELGGVWVEILSNVESASLTLAGEFSASLGAAVGASDKIAANFADISSTGGVDLSSGAGKSLSDQVANLKTTSEGAVGASDGPKATKSGGGGGSGGGADFVDKVEANQPSIRRQPRADKITHSGKSERQKQIDADRNIPMADRTKGGTLREELDARMDSMKSESEKNKQAEEKKTAGAEKGKKPEPVDPLVKLVTSIKTLMEKLENKLPTSALTA